MRLISKTIILGFFAALLVVSPFLPTEQVQAQSPYSMCNVKLDFLLNGQVFTGSTILRKVGNNYQVKVTIEQTDHYLCQPPMYWKLTYLSYTPSDNPNEPTEIPSTGTQLDGGAITTRTNVVKTINLGNAALQTYAYTLFIATDSDFRQNVYTKERSVTFTDDPKAATPIVPPTGTPPTGQTATSTATVGYRNTIDFDRPLGTLFNPLNDNLTRPEAIVIRVINIALTIAGIAAVLFIIIGGFMMVTSAGNESRVAKGKQTLIYAVAGLILSLLSFSIVAIIQSIIS